MTSARIVLFYPRRVDIYLLKLQGITSLHAVVHDGVVLSRVHTSAYN